MIEIGVRLSAGADVVREARRAERLGFDFLCAGEHVFARGDSGNAFVALAVAAGATERIKLLSAVTLLPLYPAALAAKMAVVLDDASGGRFHLGVGVGGEHPGEFLAAGVPVRERGPRTDEALAVIRRLMSGGTVDFTGRFNRLEGAELRPAPRRPGGPPIWVAGRGEAAMRRAGRLGDAWLPYLLRPERVRAGIEVARAEARDCGRDPRRLRFGSYVFVSVAADGRAARAEGRRALGAKYDRADDSRLTGHVVAGTVEECRERLMEYVAAGVDALMLNLACAPERRERMERVVAEELAPALRQAAGTR